MSIFVNSRKGIRNEVESRILWWKEILIVSVIGLLVLSIYFFKNFNGLEYPDSMRYAAIARNIVTGAGYIEPELWPARLVYEDEAPFYVNRARPIFPMIIASAFKIFGVSENAVALSSGVFFVFSLILLWMLSVHLFSRRVAWVTVLLFAFDPTMLHYSISGLTEIPFLFFLTLALFILVKAWSLSGLFVAGIVFGIATLVRSEALFYALVSIILLWLYFRTLNMKKMVAVGLGLFIVLVPYWVWSWRAFGSPFFDLNILWFLGRTASFPEYTIMRSLEHVNMLTAVTSNPFDIPEKFMRALGGNIYLVPFHLTNPYIVLLLFIGLFGIFSDRMELPIKAKILLSLLGVLFLFQVLFTSLTIPDQGVRYFVPFLGIILLFAGRSLIFIFDLWKSHKNIFKNVVLVCALVFLVCPTLYCGLFRGKSMGLSSRAEYVELCSTVDQHMKGDGVLLSNAPNKLTWYTGLQTMVIPNTLEEVKQVDQLVGVSGVVIVLPSSLRYLGTEWSSVIKDRYLSSDFKLIPYQSDNLQALIFIRQG